MSENDELKKIKKVYGERFMKLCRELFPTILEEQGLLYEVLSSSFSGNSQTLYEDIVTNGLVENFKNYIYSKVDIEDKKRQIVEEKTPYELLDEVGYDLFECTNEAEIQAFKKYYAKGEELCTFNGGRLSRCVVFFAVKKDVDLIQRKDFIMPKREDKYGTSVMGIQFHKHGSCTVSIKNRYNHRVNNPDATYGNDLDRIASGLTQSFANLLLERGLELNSKNKETFNIPNYVVASDGKYYKFNKELNGVYYCPGNIVIEDGQVHEFENPERELLIDYFVIDTKNKTVKLYDEKIRDSFTDDFENIEKIEIRKNTKNKNGERIITIQKANQEEPIIIEIDKNNQIIRYTNNNLKKVGDNFLLYNTELEQLNVSALEETGNSCLYNNNRLRQLEVLSLKKVGDFFLGNNRNLIEIDCPNLEETGHFFLSKNTELMQLCAPRLKKVGNYFLSNNKKLNKFEAKNLKEAGNGFLYSNRDLEQFNAESLTKVGNDLLYQNIGLSKLYIPSLEETGNGCLYNNKGLREIYAPRLKKVGNDFLHQNTGLERFEAPSLEEAGYYCLYYNKGLTEFQASRLKEVGDGFLRDNTNIKRFDASSLIETGNGFLHCNRGLVEFKSSSLTKVGNGCLWCNTDLRKLDTPNLSETGNYFLGENTELIELNAPKLPTATWKRLNKIVNKNLEKQRINTQINVNPQTIAKLDKKNEIAESEISKAGNIIENLKKVITKLKDRWL